MSVDHAGHRDSSAARDAGPTAVIAAAAAIAALVVLFQLSRPGLLFGVTPDISVYLGGAVRLLHGAVPYRDFAFVQPPGIVVLTAPFALLADATGTRDALAILRLLTPLLAAADVVMAGLLVRHRGRAATLCACAVMALFPAELYAVRGPQLEPVVVTLCLLALTALFVGGQVTSTRGRMLLAGLAFGLAVAVKLTALIPLAVTVIVLLWRARRALAPFALGAAVSVAAVVGPFLVLAPAAFVRDVLATAVARVPVAGRAPLAMRLGEATGVSILGASTAVTVALALLVAACAALPPVVLRRTSSLETVAAGSVLLVGAAQLAPALYFAQYAALVTPFLALALAFAVARLPSAARGVAVAAGAAALVGAQLVYVAHEAVPDVAAAVDAAVPAGACVISESPVYLVTSDRFLGPSRCSSMTDPEGTMLALGHDGAAAAAAWNDAFRRSDYVVSAVPISSWGLPGQADIPAYVAANFSVRRAGSLLVYARR